MLRKLGSGIALPGGKGEFGIEGVGRGEADVRSSLSLSASSLFFSCPTPVCRSAYPLEGWNRLP
jgi:hypothetical protein